MKFFKMDLNFRILNLNYNQSYEKIVQRKI